MENNEKIADYDNDLLPGIGVTCCVAAFTWVGLSFSASWIWVPFGSILVLSFVGGFIDALERYGSASRDPS